MAVPILGNTKTYRCDRCGYESKQVAGAPPQTIAFEIFPGGGEKLVIAGRCIICFGKLVQENTGKMVEVTWPEEKPKL